MKTLALITGASSGIGKSLAIIHAKAGGDVILVARSRDALESLKKELERTHHITAHVMVKDLSKPNAAQELYDEVIRNNWHVDILINNAGFGGQGLFHERALEKDLAMITLNVQTLVALTRLFLPDMVGRERGKILMIGSTAGFMPGPLQATYYATKAFVNSFSLALSEELQGTGVSVTVLCPGAVNTGFIKAANVDGTKLFASTVSAASVAQAGYTAMLQGKRLVISPGRLRLFIRMVGLFPRGLLLKTIYRLQQK